jgi:exopolysaccharide production protein ExoY
MFRFDTFGDFGNDRPASPDAEQPRMDVAPPVIGTGARIAKRVFDITGALLFFALFGSLYVLVALSVRRAGRGPVHCAQVRLGRSGRPFRLYRFNTMVPEADQVLAEFLARDPAARRQWNASRRLDDDPRFTRIGLALRTMHLEAMPQFWNVLKGDMSLVGPHPCLERQRTLYGAGWAHYAAMRPGLTGPWQLGPTRGGLTFARRGELDLDYARRWSLWLDLRILGAALRALVFEVD